ncbi:MULTISPECIES: DUF4129 domain-containing protein [unclassified Kitasatospora]|uniref:DUF4129 domain-containing protein n=1 Tax=unclassified Kitasatospora TaxID=2633591 RepID=UPI0024743854|nr:DUF4129 domain-containing protein [Kitasatospora sp. MAP12-44]
MTAPQDSAGRENADDGRPVRRTAGTGGSAPLATRAVAAQAVALALVAVAGLVLAAVLLRPDGAAWTSARGPLSGNFTLMLLLAFGWLLALTGLTGRYRTGVRGATSLSPRAERLKDATRFLLPALAVALPIVLVVLGTPTVTQHPDLKVVIRRPRDPGGPTGGHPAVSLEILVVLVALVALAAAVIMLWPSRRRKRAARPNRRPLRPETAAVVDEATLAEAVESARRALHGDDARAAVIACYAAMEQSLAASGTAREASDSPTDLLARVVANGILRDTDATELTELFREARYSSHPMSQPHLHRARTALDAIAATLAEWALIAERTAGSEALATSEVSR